MTGCTRCGGPGLLAVESAVLCAGCDLDHPTGGPIVLWFAVNGQIDTTAQLDEVAALVRRWVDGLELEASVDAWMAQLAAPAAAGAGLICDFCETAVPRWAYRAGPAASVPAGDWYACDDCRPYVDAREWAGLADVVGDERTESWVAFAEAEPCAARPWPPRARIYRWP
ncbi:DUF6300 family protein [Cryptosporangium phraense]|uniref:Uncharacterized protein n=1 Tax=Cryptosporangium phraense TaxID=2593070 RepID=A0A545AM47_9ACTN|nr:DUF6300 family protein [Cryptosporangium phraense]TQS42399.1 hypothetical protein FL583_24120 [Cryptosporangium phraense]